MARHLIAFVLFATAYALPALPLASLGTTWHAPTMGALMESMVRVPVVLGLALNLGTQLGLLLIVYAATTWLASQWASRTGTARPIASWATLTLVWLWMVSGNGMLFARSGYSVWFSAAPHGVAFAATSTVLAGLLALVLVRHPPVPRQPKLWLGGTALAATLALVLTGWSNHDHPKGQGDQRNIVIIGVDSLSAHLMQRERAHLPNLSALLSQSTAYERAYTPLGRTYPAWASILSGQPAAGHGALFNLRGIEHAQRQDLLGTTLKAQGYRSVYAIDERRFNNIDESFGFDAVVGPRAGVLDFVVQPFNDTPLANVLLQNRLARWLLPYSYLNVASAANYDAQGFVDEIAGATASPQPLFLAVHFLSGHFPFKTRHATVKHPDANAIRARHIEALTTADVQVGRLMQVLAAQGRLDDTMVILLSDHGEAVGDDEPLREAGGTLVRRAGYGHGADLLSEHQSRIVMATLHYRGGRVQHAPSIRSEQVSLLDVRAAAEHFMRSGEVQLRPGSDCIVVETELRLPSASDYRHLDARRVAAEGASLYEVDSKGRLRLREEHLEGLLAKKDVGLRCADRITVFKPVDGRYRAYRLTTGLPPEEMQPLPEDVARIDAYRRALMQLGAKATAQASAKAAG
ncbi:MAG TPA: sulfatase-like hydrolase/transferase [Ideonella sp.]|uniref:sulfatase-like hydrolase/transferase n=1 Tax=Ideonella sp. TaxID=1929293 RepID=UPI002E2F18C0|nr:sulfatase-like hydrolase/transferase [Ideonella sp.]HEX5687654.1 sulfatase-like hydrolase/transferase [Ideonella sp.]